MGGKTRMIHCSIAMVSRARDINGVRNAASSATCQTAIGRIMHHDVAGNAIEIVADEMNLMMASCPRAHAGPRTQPRRAQSRNIEPRRIARGVWKRSTRQFSTSVRRDCRVVESYAGSAFRSISPVPALSDRLYLELDEGTTAASSPACLTFLGTAAIRLIVPAERFGLTAGLCMPEQKGRASGGARARGLQRRGNAVGVTAFQGP
jgi:hypothetical protein